MDGKICTKCKKFKEYKNFSKKPSAKDKHQSQCKACGNEYYQINKEKITKYRQVNKEKIAARELQYRRANKEKLVAYRQANKEKKAEYRQTNKEKITASKVKYREANKENIAARAAEYHKANKEKILEYRQANKEAYQNYKSKRRALKNNSGGTFTQQEFKALIEDYDNRCYYCLNEHTETPHADHFIPLSKRGNNFISNIVPACPRCNLSKNAKMPQKFKSGEAFIPKSPEIWRKENNL